MILAGDIGATKCNLALYERCEGRLIRRAKQRFLARDYPGLEAILEEFLAHASTRPTAAAFGVAGPVTDNEARISNRPWTVSGESLARHLGLAHVTLYNDLEATAHGIEVLDASDLLTLNQGDPPPRRAANQVVIAAGTGLGEAIRFWDGHKHIVSASEGGHCDFPPRTDEEIELLRFLRRRFSAPIAVERILSGGGFRLLHEFLEPAGKHASFDDPAADVAKEITGNARDGKCRACSRALDLWVSVYGAEAGNLALKALARGGVYVAGGIAPKIAEKLKDGAFLEAFCDKWRFRDLLSRMPVYVVLNEDCPLLGAAACAASDSAR